MSKRIIHIGAKAAALAMIAMLVMPLFVAPVLEAQERVRPLITPTITTVADILGILQFVIRIIFTLLLIVAVGFILFAAFKYLTAMGDPAKVGEAHKALLSAAIAIAVALLATGVEFIVRNILGQGATIR